MNDYELADAIELGVANKHERYKAANLLRELVTIKSAPIAGWNHAKTCHYHKHKPADAEQYCWVPLIVKPWVSIEEPAPRGRYIPVVDLLSAVDIHHVPTDAVAKRIDPKIFLENNRYGIAS